ncbi:hypothetical protein AVEN_117496-1, partial [Araneus ventricosus]
KAKINTFLKCQMGISYHFEIEPLFNHYHNFTPYQDFELPVLREQEHPEVTDVDPGQILQLRRQSFFRKRVRSCDYR